MGCILINDSIVASDLINSTDKLVYGVITSLAKSTGYCYASNEYIGKKVNLTKRSITESIKRLKKANYIRVETANYQRHIYIV